MERGRIFSGRYHVLGGSLSALDAELQARGSRLLRRHGPSAAALDTLVADTGAEAVFWNRKYEPATQPRDAALKKTLRERGLQVESFKGVLLFEPAFFADARPDTALDMIARLPGFAFESGDSGTRGLAGTAGNVLIDGGANGLLSLVVGGVDVTAGGTVSGTYGELVVTVASGVYSWTYTLNDNAPHTNTAAVGSADPFPEENFSVVLTDSDGDATPAAPLVIQINDDGPLALDDEARRQVQMTVAQKLREKHIKKMEEKAKSAVDDGKKFLEENGKKSGVKTTASGLQYKVNAPGTGRTPTVNDTVTVHYRGTLSNGSKDVEFRIEVDVVGRKYSITPSEWISLATDDDSPDSTSGAA